MTLQKPLNQIIREFYIYIYIFRPSRKTCPWYQSNRGGVCPFPRREPAGVSSTNPPPPPYQSKWPLVGGPQYLSAIFVQSRFPSPFPPPPSTPQGTHSVQSRRYQFTVYPPVWGSLFPNKVNTYCTVSRLCVIVVERSFDTAALGI